MHRIVKSLLSIALVAFCPSPPPPPPEVPDVVELSFDDLRDKIRGRWAAQTIDVTFGGPTEFRYNGTMIQPYEPIPWYACRRASTTGVSSRCGGTSSTPDPTKLVS